MELQKITNVINDLEDWMIWMDHDGPSGYNEEVEHSKLLIKDAREVLNKILNNSSKLKNN
jgi:hypothetical protein